MVEHGNGIALLPARTETRHFFRFVWPFARALCFLEGRPHFHYVDGRRAAFNSGVPMVLVAYDAVTATNAECLRDCGLGKFLELKP